MKTQNLCTVIVGLVALLSAAPAAYAGKGGQAAVSLTNASAALSQASDTAWTLEKTGALSGSTVTWTITATQGTTSSGHLFVNGFMTVVNSGSKGATIGNIVVNLQTKSGSSWVTQASDIADATHDDAATSAAIDPHGSSENKSSFTENAASGPLQFMDAKDNTVFSLKPQKTIAPGASVSLLFTAQFDNTVLQLADGSTARVEVTVSFGNSTSIPPSAPNVDINGNGTIDKDEAWVRSVPARLTLSVPAQTAANGTVILSDTADDIATTGTMTFSNPSFDLGVLTGTVTAQVDGGASGGTITNCAHLTGTGATATVGGYTFTNVQGVNLEACNTQTVPPPNTCTPGTVGCGWKDGNLTTYPQAAWGSGGVAELTLLGNYGSVYATTGGEFIIGSSTGFSAIWTDPNILVAYLPTSGPAGALDATLLNPTTTSSGVFGGDVAALKLDIDFGDANVLPGTAGVKFGDLTLCNFSTLPALNGMTVRQFLQTVNTLLGGGLAVYSIGQLDPVTNSLTVAFPAGSVSTFAQQHLFNGACPVWQNGDLTTYSQNDWGGTVGTNPGATLLAADYDTVYAASFGIVTVGLTSGGFSMAFSDYPSVLAYLPASGAIGPLDANVSNPTSTASGAFGGEVLGLELNVDFSDKGALSSNLGLHFGDLTFCGMSTLPALNGTAVRQLLATVNTLLGGGSATYSISDVYPVLIQLNAAFFDGAPDDFAQQHLVNGACP